MYLIKKTAFHPETLDHKRLEVIFRRLGVSALKVYVWGEQCILGRNQRGQQWQIAHPQTPPPPLTPLLKAGKIIGARGGHVPFLANEV